MAAHQAPPSLGFSRQAHCNGLPFPSPMHESEKWNLTWLPLNHTSHPEHLAWDKGKQKLFCGHVCRHQTKGAITSIQMQIWWGARRAGWRRRCLKQFYFSEPSLRNIQIYDVMWERRKMLQTAKFSRVESEQWGTFPGLESTIRTEV